MELGKTVLAHSHRFIHAMFAIDAVRRPVGEAGGSPQLRAFLDAAGQMLAVLRDTVETGERPVAPRGDLRALQQDLAATLERDPGRVGGAANVAILIDATDRITNSLDTLFGALRRMVSPGTAPVG